MRMWLVLNRDASNYRLYLEHDINRIYKWLILRKHQTFIILTSG